MMQNSFQLSASSRQFDLGSGGIWINRMQVFEKGPKRAPTPEKLRANS
jgi:hypothetical protein